MFSMLIVEQVGGLQRSTLFGRKIDVLAILADMSATKSKGAKAEQAHLNGQKIRRAQFFNYWWHFGGPAGDSQQ